MSQVAFGVDHLLAKLPSWRLARLGLVTNAAARTASTPRLPTRQALVKHGFNLVRLFSPEHGLLASAPDGASVPDGADALTGLPVGSLYGDQLCPPAEMLRDLDLVLYDLPDIGARFYTYIWTLWHVLEACAQAGKPLVVLDRPNPLGGELAAVEGPILDADRWGSFLGRWPIPVRYSLTCGELARLWNTECRFQAELSVIACSGWNRAMHWPDTGLPFVSTSPAIPGYESALLYPGLCLFEATNLSVGRGTPWPFQVIGAPWLNQNAVTEHFNSHRLAHVSLEPCRFTPRQGPFAEEPCAGLRLAASRPVRPVRVGLVLLASVIATHSSRFSWAVYPTAANPSGLHHFERLIGREDIRPSLEQNPTNLEPRLIGWTDSQGWTERVGQFGLYS